MIAHGGDRVVAGRTRTYQIDEIDARSGWSTIDKVRHDGHFIPQAAVAEHSGRGRLLGGEKATGWDLLNT